MAEVVRFWRAVELFGPQRVPAVGAGERVSAVRAGRPLPWEDGAGLPAAGPRSVWRHTVYCGVFAVDRVRRVLAEVFPDPDSDPESESEDAEGARDSGARLGRSAGESALLAFTVDQDGLLAADSVSVSSCAWAVGRTLSPGPADPRWLEGFTAAAARCERRVFDVAEGRTAPRDDAPAAGPPNAEGRADDSEGRADDSEGRADDTEGRADDTEEEPGRRPLTVAALTSLTAWLAGHLGVTGDLVPAGARIRSVQVRADRTGEAAGPDFLNSFVAADLDLVAAELRAGRAGRALTSYLTGTERLDLARREDLRAHPEALLAGVAPALVPLGRWPSATGQPLVLSQQFAVNRLLDSLGGARAAGVFPVNGPPGTGKTTMLRDVIAALVTRRACALAQLARPQQAFGGSHTWRGEYTRTVRELRPQLTGYEMVVASANNAAVANVTDEIPARTAVAEEWWDEAGYLPEQARLMLGGVPAWGAVAARLGNRANRDDFTAAFWWGAARGPRGSGVGAGTDRGLRQVLAEGAGEPVDWAAAVRRFKAARREVERLRRARQRVAEALPDADADAATANADAAVTGPAADGAGSEGGTSGRHRAEQAVLEESGPWHTVLAARARWGERVPDPAAFTSAADADTVARRERSSPWADEEFTAARTRLFLEALRLHEAFVRAAAPTMLKNLDAAMEVVGGHAPKDLPAAAVRAAWQSLFLVVPVVSTTFASYDRLFAGLGREDLGWLFVDEAGQAAPQLPVGALWRSRRAVFLGDPRQLEPVVVLPWRAQRTLLEHQGVAPEWAPSRTSAQGVADRSARWGTVLAGAAGVASTVSEGAVSDGAAPVWVGAPLRVHRRCDNPMFEVSNAIAYDGLMVHGVGERGSFAPPRGSFWWHVGSREAVGTWVPAEGVALADAVRRLTADGLPADGLFVLSPFREVAAGAREVLRGMVPPGRVGTVHTAQGREADVVVLILGTHPAAPGPRGWAAARPNLLNVAVTRARRRLVVIGNHTAWSAHPFFSTLAASLPFYAHGSAPRR
ncbi:DEAD/DEAH box helicase [Streptomyces sp. NBC_01190]|uniref:DEAD/DEAH box helicase n=1 Tax=Streptomyces sp. NBC_01190 TaxID=2903767 RepID=UPI0038642A3A|nr:ATP-binding protein [Streptomyces sp. NBC_01190]